MGKRGRGGSSSEHIGRKLVQMGSENVVRILEAKKWRRTPKKSRQVGSGPAVVQLPNFLAPRS